MGHFAPISKVLGPFRAYFNGFKIILSLFQGLLGHFWAIFNSSETRCPPFHISKNLVLDLDHIGPNSRVLSLNLGDFGPILGIMGLDLQHFGPIWRFLAYFGGTEPGPG